MPYEDPDPSDPMLLVGVELPADAAATRETATVFAEEFARMGFDEVRLMRMFENAFYAGAHQAYLSLGPDQVRAIVREQVGFWSRVRVRDHIGPADDQPSPHGHGSDHLSGSQEV